MAASPIPLEVANEDLVRLLLVEDKPEVASSFKDRFEAEGCSVDVAANSKEAEKNLMDRQSYQIIVADQSLGVSGTDGDQFLLNNEDLMKEAKFKVVMTANGPEAVPRRKELEAKGIPVLEKGASYFLPRIKSLINQALEDRRNAVGFRLKLKVPSLLDESSVAFDLDPVPAKRLLKILVIEDRPEVAGGLQERLEASGSTVVIAETPEKAMRLLERTSYQLIVTDQEFPNSALKGDQFILDNLDLIGKAKAIVITGVGRDMIHFQDELREKGVVILEKGDPNFLSAIRSVVDSALKEREDQIRLQLKASLEAMLNGPVATPVQVSGMEPGLQALLQKLHRLLVEWLKGDGEDCNSETIFYGGRRFSPASLIQEIEAGTEIGREHAHMFLDLVKRALPA